MEIRQRAIILVNLGSPRSARVPDVRAYLKEFLTDPCVIDLPAWARYLLVYGIIAPFRAFRSARLYSKIWSDRGFPLIYHTTDVGERVREKLSYDSQLFVAMRYGEPSLKSVLEQIKQSGFSEVLVIPLYPQFATSTTGSMVRLLRKELAGHEIGRQFRIIPHFHREEPFASIWVKKIADHDPGSYDALVFSYHGIPVRQTELGHPGHDCASLHCEVHYSEANRYCYRAACYHTTRSIARGLGLDAQELYTSFQSRFGRNWLQPFTDQTLTELAGRGKKRVLVISPAFVADCLETLVEIGKEYSHLFQESGGRELVLVPSLNSDPPWADFIQDLIQKSDHLAVDLWDDVWNSC